MYLDAIFQEGVTHVFTKPVWQHTKGVMLNLLNMPISYPVKYDISNQIEGGNSNRYESKSLPIKIPDDYFVNGDYVRIWLDLPEASEAHLVTIPVMRKSVPVTPSDDGSGSHYQYDEEDENLILDAMNSLITNNMEDE